MKILEKLILILYSVLILVISVVVCLIIFNVININQIKFCIDYIISDIALTIIVLASSIVCMLLSIKCLFFRKKKQIKKSTATDILLENESGRLLISKTAIENAVKNIVRDAMKCDSDIKTTVDIDPANNISIYIAVMIDSALRVRDLTIDLQLKIKNDIKGNFGLEVKQVNIKVDSDEKQIEKIEKQNEKKKMDDLKRIEEAKTEKVGKIEESVIEIKKDEENN
ncbi:MAG: alkaline shock response membrane anchor protein AmaP [Clostridia bacterium]|nr:alkaline shock response membrane anchor protein AmaP [Clostridia bacterium]